MKLAFIGVGNMGSAIIPRLIMAGHQVAAWNRNEAAVDALAGVTRLEQPGQAFSRHELVITMLANDLAIREVLIDSGVITTAPTGGIHLIMSTISPALVEELQQLHERAGINYVAAPVFGIPAVAARGGLQILAAGPADAIDALAPVFSAIGQKIWPMGHDQRHAAVAKIAGNLMITQAIEAMAEATALTEAYGLSAATFLDVVTQTMFASPSYQRYARNIAEDTYEPGFKLSLGLKDVDLALDAAKAKGVSMPAADVVQGSLARAVDAGLGTSDWSALAKVVRDRSAGPAVPARAKAILLVSYTAKPGDRFDRAYYLDHHLPMVETAWKPFGLESIEALFEPDARQATTTMCVCQFRNDAALRMALASPATAAVMADVQDFTDLLPVQRILARIKDGGSQAG